MKKHVLQRIVLFVACMGLLILGVCGLRLESQHRQMALNRQLIATLMKADTQQALLLVGEGADPTTPYKPPQALSLRLLWDDLLHRSPPSYIDNNPTAFQIVCGRDCWRTEPTRTW